MRSARTTPDLFAAYLLPSILSEFAPNIELEVRCALSSKRMAALERGEIDLALVTGMPTVKGASQDAGRQRLA
jgi:DNA-binding transcriptional LysR family regulator